jgi:hypothetical protein
MYGQLNSVERRFTEHFSEPRSSRDGFSNILPRSFGD